MISCFSTECAYLYLLERQHAEHEVLVLNGIQRTKHLLSLFDLFVLVICAAPDYICFSLYFSLIRRKREKERPTAWFTKIKTRENGFRTSKSSSSKFMKVYLTNPHSPHGSSGQKKRQRDKVVSATLGCTSNRNNLKLTNTLGLR